MTFNIFRSMEGPTNKLITLVPYTGMGKIVFAMKFAPFYTLHTLTHPISFGINLEL